MFGVAVVLRGDVVIGLVSALYALFGVIFVAGYVPQVRAVWRSRNGAADVSLGTWALWSTSSTVSMLYASLVIKDWRYAFVCVGNMAGCYAVTVAVLLRRRYHRASPVSELAAAGA